MTAAINYYYAPISGFAYLGEPRLRVIAAETGAEIRYRPVDIGKLFAASGTTPPFKQSAVRLSYRQEEMGRWAAKLGLSVNPAPRYWPTQPDLACRVIYAAEKLGFDIGAVSFALLSAVWVEDRNVADPEHVAAVLNAMDLPASVILAEAQTDTVKAVLEAYTGEAISAGVFGSPTYIVHGVRFWGQDRLDFVADILRGEAG